VTLARVVRSEWLKLVSLRSTVIAYAAIAGVLVIVAGVMLTLPGADDSGRAGDALLTLLVLVELLVGITGVLASTGEYGAATIRSTLAAVPRRLPVLAAKLLVHGGLVLALFVPAMLVGLLAGEVFAPRDVGPLTDGQVLRGLGGSALVFTATCVLGVAFGMLTRSTPAAIGILFAVMFLPVMVTLAPEVTAFVPGRAAQAIVFSDNPPEAKLLGGAEATVVFVAWAAGAIAAAAAALRRRDA
jgi:hypothetical protein